jgi:hypothetical protein
MRCTCHTTISSSTSSFLPNFYIGSYFLFIVFFFMSFCEKNVHQILSLPKFSTTSGLIALAFNKYGGMVGSPVEASN